LQISAPALLGRRGAGRAGTTLLALVGLWLAAYGTGLWPWLGYASQSRASINIGRFPVGEMSTGRFRAGLGTFVFFKGQTIVLSYDADIGDGCLSMHVWRLAGEEGSADYNRCVSETGRGEWAVPVTATGLYHIYVTARPVKGRWDMSYTVWWGARA
jgi:hypothetical protein